MVVVTGPASSTSNQAILGDFDGRLEQKTG